MLGIKILMGEDKLVYQYLNGLYADSEPTLPDKHNQFCCWTRGYRTNSEGTPQESEVFLGLLTNSSPVDTDMLITGTPVGDAYSYKLYIIDNTAYADIYDGYYNLLKVVKIENINTNQPKASFIDNSLRSSANYVLNAVGPTLEFRTSAILNIGSPKSYRLTCTNSKLSIETASDLTFIDITVSRRDGIIDQSLPKVKDELANLKSENQVLTDELTNMRSEINRLAGNVMNTYVTR